MFHLKLMQGSKTQGDSVHFAYKLNALLSVSLPFGCNTFSTYKKMKNILPANRMKLCRRSITLVFFIKKFYKVKVMTFSVKSVSTT